MYIKYYIFQKCKYWIKYSNVKIKKKTNVKKSTNILKVVSQMIWALLDRQIQDPPQSEDWQVWSPIGISLPSPCSQSESGSRQRTVTAAGVRNYDAHLSIETATTYTGKSFICRLKCRLESSSCFIRVFIHL